MADQVANASRNSFKAVVQNSQSKKIIEDAKAIFQSKDKLETDGFKRTSVPEFPDITLYRKKLPSGGGMHVFVIDRINCTPEEALNSYFTRDAEQNKKRTAAILDTNWQEIESLADTSPTSHIKYYAETPVLPGTRPFDYVNLASAHYPTPTDLCGYVTLENVDTSLKPESDKYIRLRISEACDVYGPEGEDGCSLMTVIIDEKGDAVKEKGWILKLMCMCQLGSFMSESDKRHCRRLRMLKKIIEDFHKK